jgi:uncharacterized RDD family membrane protein YckC
MATRAPERATPSGAASLPDYTWEPKEGGATGPRAGFWRRLAALLVDSVIVGAAIVVLALVLGPIGAIVGVLASYAYYIVMEGMPAGQTLGKKALGIRIVDANTGKPIGYGRAAIRNLARILSGWALGIGYLWMLWDREKQTWHDKLASSHVVPTDAYPVR